MTLDKAKLDALRPRVEETPEGSVARELLAMIDADLAEYRVRERRRLVDMIRGQGRTPEDAEAIVAAYEAGAATDTETVKCWVCEGFGTVLDPHGGERCRTCNGSGETWRFKDPRPR